MRISGLDIRRSGAFRAGRMLRLVAVLPLVSLSACLVDGDLPLTSSAALPLSEVNTCAAGQDCSFDETGAVTGPAALLPVPQDLVESLPPSHVNSALDAARADSDQRLANELEKASLPVDRYDLGEGYLADGIVPQ